MVNLFLLPGTLYIAKSKAEIITILGSCVSVCLCDVFSYICGINHYLLPFSNGNSPSSLKYGDIAIPKLIEETLEAGAGKNNLAAKVFGGGAVIQTYGRERSALNVGRQNIEIAFDLLDDNDIKIINYDVGGFAGRKIKMSTDNFEIELKRIKMPSFIMSA